MGYTDELYHHGILGMKWGIRRYQNKDGSLTAAGRKRLGYEDTRNGDYTLQKYKSPTARRLEFAGTELLSLASYVAANMIPGYAFMQLIRKQEMYFLTILQTIRMRSVQQKDCLLNQLLIFR